MGDTTGFVQGVSGPLPAKLVDLGDGSYALPSMPKLITADADLTQLITVTTAGTPVQGPAKTNPGGWMITPLTGTGYFMFHGQTKANKGYPIAAGTQFPLMVSDLSTVDFDAADNGTKIVAAKI